MKLKDSCPLEEKVYQSRQHIKKQRRYFANKGPSSQSYGFSVVMYRCESWTIKKAECQRINAFQLWCWRRLLRVSWTAGDQTSQSNESILKEINPEYSLEGLILKLKLQYFSHLMGKANSLESLKAGEGGERGWDGWMGIINSMVMSLSKPWEIVKDGEAWHPAVHGVTKSRTGLGEWTTTNSN